MHYFYDLSPCLCLPIDILPMHPSKNVLLSIHLAYKHHDMMENRLKLHEEWMASPCTDINLPKVPNDREANSFTYSIRTGVGWRSIEH
ncbi:unnamed protein product [Trichobilharzia regenti]|nr:unnamed protein product [Trichobilharzia regenti]